MVLELNPRATRLFFMAISSAFLAGGTMLGAPLSPNLMIESHDHEQTTSGGQPILRFSSWTMNLGSGPLELRGGTIHPNNTQDIYQWIYDSDGGHTETLVGILSLENGFWRFTDSADYFLKEINEDNSVGGTLGSQEKVAYCLVDTARLPNPPPNRGVGKWGSCLIF